MIIIYKLSNQVRSTQAKADYTTPSCFASSATLIGSSLGGSSLGGSLGAKLRGSSTWPLILKGLMVERGPGR